MKWAELHLVVKSTDLDPVFGIILCVILHPSCKPHLVIDELRTVNYVRHFHAFEVEPLSVRSVVVTTPCKLADYNVVGNYQPFHSSANYNGRSTDKCPEVNGACQVIIISARQKCQIELWIELELESVRLLMNLQVALAVVVALVKDNAQDS